MSTSGENEQPRATVTSPAADEAAGTPAHGLEWQSELDSAMSDLDTQLSHPRRRASDAGPQTLLPELKQVHITNELLDEIAWRVSQQLRLSQPATARLDVAVDAAVEPRDPL